LKKSVNCAIEVVLSVTDSTTNNLIYDCEVKLSSIVLYKLTLKVKGGSTFIFFSTVYHQLKSGEGNSSVGLHRGCVNKSVANYVFLVGKNADNSL